MRLMPSQVDRPIDGVSKEDKERERHETAVQDLEAAACTVMTVPVRRWCLLVRNRLLHLRLRINFLFLADNCAVAWKDRGESPSGT